MKKLTSLHIYPVKSCKGISLDTVAVTPKGAANDRRWMVIDDTGRFMSQRKHPQMALIDVKMEGKSLQIRLPNNPWITIFHSGPSQKAVIWNDTIDAIDCGDQAAEMFANFLQAPCRLVYMADDAFRQVNQKYSQNPKDDLALTDGYPFLVISEASLADLNSRLNSPVKMDQFRPTLVISGCQPYEEDQWKRIKIGNVEFRSAKLCSRCTVTTVDQTTGVASPDSEPLITLAKYRKMEGGVMFGQNLIHLSLGQLRVGDSLQVLE